MPIQISRETKDKVLSAIKDEGLSVADAAAKFGVKPQTVYGWIGAQAKNGHTSALEFQKLKKENEMLKMLIGALTLENEKVKKNSVRS
jgi:transposase-like protein